jgi:hypothetical protein
MEAVKERSTKSEALLKNELKSSSSQVSRLAGPRAARRRRQQQRQRRPCGGGGGGRRSSPRAA